MQTSSLELSSLLDLYDQSEEIRHAVAQNFGILKCIRGGLRMSENHRISFDPRREYWHLPERRLLVAYFAERWTGRFVPARDLRSLGQRVLSYFDQARTGGVISFRGVEYEQAGGFKNICAALSGHAQRLPTFSEWHQLRTVWPKVSETAAEDIADFLLVAESNERWEEGFRRRLPWFGYLGAQSDEDLRSRQAFFFGYANLWTTTNAYVRAGAQAFAPVIQNTRSDVMLDAALQWATGTNPILTGFRVIGRDDTDDQPQDRSQHAPVVEVYGFLNLERGPFYNNRAELYREWFHIDGRVNPYELSSKVGEVTAEWLKQNSAAESHLATFFRSLVDQPFITRVEFETIESPKVRKHVAQVSEELLDTVLFAELDSIARSELFNLDPNEAARVMIHLLLDGKLYIETSRAEAALTNAAQTAKESALAPVQSTTAPSSARPSMSRQILPEVLRPYGERALAYLTAGFHVLFAGAPGTGKTTLAQFVGHAWDLKLLILPDQMITTAAPLTTVGNSAWSPFHTIGGLMPTGKGTFTPHAGLFIDPASTTESIWRLRNGAVVLDEMNRADLDRCIGELYPLLSGSVECVSPAGLPGVQSILASPNFRVLATVNDSHLDDIVFPISEGLARRFQRIDLPGASRDDIFGYLRLNAKQLSDNPRHAATHEAITAFFELARDQKLLLKAEDGDRLPFGVAYFALLKAWMEGHLNTPLIEATVPEQARDLLVASLRTLGRSRWSEALRIFTTNV